LALNYPTPDRGLTYTYTRATPKVSGLDILDNNIFQNLYISETYIFTDSYESAVNMA